ncbi:hypothetical protein WJX72_011446 [[Myrmecia] bisecta]|uniref:Universal stress protein n=1 Tax=[Myrmecia] bisecta TaxID=41462 RepID=A0AAW1P5R6_9CHLO
MFGYNGRRRELDHTFQKPCYSAQRSGKQASQWFRICTSAAEVPPASRAEDVAMVKYDHLLLTIIDPNPYLSDGSKTAVATVAGLAGTYGSKITVLLVDQDTAGADADPQVRLDNIKWHLGEGGCTSYEVVTRDLAKIGSHSSSVAVGDVADEIAADLVVMSSEAVHAKAVDANLLAEFVPCPMLLLP